ncbi:MAG: VCBS repeat-containing protein [Acidobacteriia bacterium]|nr:VCBS repeat-containing protein [Terriglobia bacterium]
MAPNVSSHVTHKIWRTSVAALLVVCNLAGIALWASGNVTCPVNFSAPLIFPAGSSPNSIAFTTFGGQPMFGTTDNVHNIISMVRGTMQADGSFQWGAPIIVPTDNSPQQMVFGDFPRIGMPGPAVVNFNSNNLMIFRGILNGGVPAFSAIGTYPTDFDPIDLAIGDFNADGSPDLVVVSHAANDLDFFFGGGDGTFSAGTPLPTGTSPVGVITGDFTNHGLFDIATLNQGSSTISVFPALVSPGGTFGPRIDNPVLPNPISFAVGDFLGNGIPGFVVTNGSPTNNVQVYGGDGTGHFSPIGSPFTGGVYVAVGDVNGDGIPDIITGAPSGTISIFPGIGNGTFVTPPTTFTSGNGLSGITVGDFNGDGQMDFAISNSQNNMVSVFLNNRTCFNPIVKQTVPVGGTWSLYMQNTAGSQINDGWCLNFTESPPPHKKSTDESLGEFPNPALLNQNPYGLAVFSLTQGGNVVTEAGVPASPPTTDGEIFIDFRSNVASKSNTLATGFVNTNTGFAIVNRGNAAAHISFILRDGTGTQITGTGHGTLAVNNHIAKFINQLSDLAADFTLPANFSTTVKFATLEIQSDQPLSIVALRSTINQRGETLLTTTPSVDLTSAAPSGTVNFPQLADGGGFHTTLFFVNRSSSTFNGTVQFTKDDGTPLTVVNATDGHPLSSFHASLPPGGSGVFQTDGSPANINTGSVQVIPDNGSPSLVGAGVFSLVQGGILVTESGIPSAAPTTHARIYVDESRGHDTGLAMSNPNGASVNVILKTFQLDGITPVGKSNGPVNISAGGHKAAFVGQFISGIPVGFTGVLDISSPTPIAAVTLRSLTNKRGEVLLTTFPIADYNASAPFPVVFPQIAVGGGFQTQFITLSGGAADAVTLSFFGDDGSSLAIGKSQR